MFSLAGAGGGLGLGGWPETEEGPAHYFKAGSIVTLHFSSLINLLHSISPVYILEFLCLLQTESHMLKMTVLFDMILVRVAVK